MKRRNILLFACLSLAACGMPQNALQVDNDGGGKFSGHAGPKWKAEELPPMVGAVVCGGEVPSVFEPRLLNGGWIFSGNC